MNRLFSRTFTVSVNNLALKTHFSVMLLVSTCELFVATPYVALLKMTHDFLSLYAKFS